MIRMHLGVLAALSLFSVPSFAQDGDEVGANWGGEGGKMAAGEVGEAASVKAGQAVYDDLLRVDDREPPKGTPVVWARLYPVGKKWEIALGFEMSVIDKYSKHTGGKLGGIYHFDELFAAHLYGGYLHGQPTSLMVNAQDVSRNAGGSNVCNPNGSDPATLRYCLPDTNTMSWFVGGEFIAEPFYGKLNLVSELALNFDIFFGAGAGITGRKGFYTQSEGLVEVVDDPARAGTAPFVSLMGGVRVWVMKNLALRVEARNYSWAADRPYLELNQPQFEQADYINTWTMTFGLGATL
ncbi:MAG: outer membrane beta-barrel domain-containing protein, partial [Myxococcota bacterium]|nr:outer membrane beta-barrel domain-containing protein [Myxococcota bacterium]